MSANTCELCDAMLPPSGVCWRCFSDDADDGDDDADDLTAIDDIDESDPQMEGWLP